MLIIIGEGLPPKVSGYIKTMLLEVAPHTFVGVVSARVRTQLVAHVRAHMGAYAGCTVIYTSNTPQGYCLQTYGHTTWQCLDLDGIHLMARRQDDCAVVQE